MAKILLRFNESTGNAVYINPDNIDFVRCVKEEDGEYCRICVNGELIEVEENFDVVKMILEKQDLVDAAHVLY